MVHPFRQLHKVSNIASILSQTLYCPWLARCVCVLTSSLKKCPGPFYGRCLSSVDRWHRWYNTESPCSPLTVSPGEAVKGEAALSDSH